MFESMNSITNASNALNAIAKRQKIIGENLANVDTPGYTRKDISFAQAMQESGFSTLENKLNKKFGEAPSGVTSTGETVNSANEIMEMQKNSLMYTVASRQMSSIITQLKTAVNVGK